MGPEAIWERSCGVGVGRVFGGVDVRGMVVWRCGGRRCGVWRCEDGVWPGAVCGCGEMVGRCSAANGLGVVLGVDDGVNRSDASIYWTACHGPQLVDIRSVTSLEKAIVILISLSSLPGGVVCSCFCMLL